MDVLELLIGLLAVAGLFASLFAALWLYLRGRHRERMAMIARGISPSAPDAGRAARLRAAALLVGTAAGTVAGYLSARYGVPAGVAYTAALALFLGLALFGCEWWDRRRGHAAADSSARPA